MNDTQTKNLIRSVILDREKRNPLFIDILRDDAPVFRVRVRFAVTDGDITLDVNTRERTTQEAT